MNDSVSSSESFLNLIVPYKVKLLNYISKNLNQNEDANDVYQETMFRAFRYFKSFDMDKDFRPWLFSIAYNEIKRHYKKINRIRFLPIFDEKRVPDRSSYTPLVGEILRSAEDLNRKQRRVFFPYYLNGLRISEIAEAFGQKESSISTDLSRARRRLRERIG